MKLENISTPAVVVRDKTARANIAKYQTYCGEHGIKLRPHIKTHKLPLYAVAQLEAGAEGITCQKISEAEVMANFGIEDILITFNVLGEAKLERLVALANRVKRLRVVADNLTVVSGLAECFLAQSMEIVVLVECDTGGGRCGVENPHDAVALAESIHNMEGVSFGGLVTYPAAGGTNAVQAFMVQAVRMLTDARIPCPVVSSGGSPDMWNAHCAPAITEYRVGTYIYNDRSLVERGVCGWDDCALRVVATVVSTPNPGRAIIDSGSKVLTTDLFGLEGYGHILGRPDLEINKLSEEHGTIFGMDGKPTDLQVGQRIEIIPNHCCVVSNMVDLVYLQHNEEDVTELYVLARGCVT